jgi:hypothetical protein
MENLSVTIDAKVLKAILLFAAKKDIRTYINTVHFERSANATYAVATNGHVVAVAKLDGMSDLPPGSFTVPREYLEAAAFAKYSLLLDQAGTSVKITSIKGNMTVPLLDAKFPDWRRVVTPQQTGEKSYFHPDYAALVEKAGQIIAPKPMAYLIQQNGNNVGYCKISDDFHAYVMPIRSGLPSVVSSPTW